MANKVTCTPIGSTTGYFSSSWTTSISGERGSQGTIVASTPTTSKINYGFRVGTIPSNAKKFSVSVGYTGANNNWKVSTGTPTITKKSSGSVVSCSVSVKWNGDLAKTSVGSHTQKVTLTGISLNVSYTTSGKSDDTSAKKTKKTKKTKSSKSLTKKINNYSTGFLACDNYIALYEKSGKKLYMFDGVVKLGYSFALSIEDSSVKGDDYEYTNNAKLQPAEISAEIVMSDTSRGKSDLTGKQASNRSSTALSTLYSLQNSRKLLKVITRDMVYNEMLIKSISISKDESNAVGWTASISLHERLIVTKPEKNKTSNVTSDTKRTSSILAGIRYGS